MSWPDDAVEITANILRDNVQSIIDQNRREEFPRLCETLPFSALKGDSQYLKSQLKVFLEFSSKRDRSPFLPQIVFEYMEAGQCESIKLLLNPMTQHVPEPQGMIDLRGSRWL